jgi:type IV secretory pathway TraG/TraD family ATPase VirD4
MSNILLIFGVLIAALVADYCPAQADDGLPGFKNYGPLYQAIMAPSSTVPGCTNTWKGGDPGFNDVKDPQSGAHTCEAVAAVHLWEERASSAQLAINTIVNASRDAARANATEVGQALDTCARLAADIEQDYHPKANEQNRIADLLAWMRQRFESFNLPVPASVDAGFRTLAKIVENPYALKVDLANAYDRGAIVGTAFNEAINETVPQIATDTDAVVMVTHNAAAHAAIAAETQPYNHDAARAAIFAAAGPDHAALAEQYLQVLDTAAATHPNASGYVAQTGRRLDAIPVNLLGLVVVCAIGAAVTFKRRMAMNGVARALLGSLIFIGAAVGSWLPLILLNALGLFPDTGWVPWVVWLAIFGIVFVGGLRVLPAYFRGLLGSVSVGDATHGTARFGGAQEAVAAKHLAPDAPADSFALGWLPGTGKMPDGRFRQGGHILTCAPTGKGKGRSAVIPNLLDYPGSAFVLDFKGENFAVTAAERQRAGQDVFLIDPYGITGTRSDGLNWLDALDPDNPDVVSLAASLADMLVVPSGGSTDPHWDDSAKELVRGLLIYIAGLPAQQRTMAELRRILTSPEDELVETMADMVADRGRGQGVVARTANSYINRPEKERGSVLSTAVRHTAWLDDPRLAAAVSGGGINLQDLKRRKMTVYIAIPPDRLRSCLGFVRGVIGLALNAMTHVQGLPPARVAFFLDEFGQLGRMDSLADNITILRGSGAQFWLFVQDLSQLKAVYPRWQSFLANTTQHYFGTSDYDTARYISDSLGQATIRFRTGSQSTSTGFRGGGSAGSSEHMQGRSLLTPDEVLRLGSARAIVMVSGEAPYLVECIDYLADAPYAGRFQPNPMHMAVQ